LDPAEAAVQPVGRTERVKAKAEAPITYLEGTNLERVYETLVPLSGSEKERARAEAAARYLVDKFVEVGTAKYDDNFRFEVWCNKFSKMWFALLEKDQEQFGQAVKDLDAESRKMGEQRDREYKKILDHMNRNKWWDLLALAGVALGGAAAAVSIGTGVGAVVIGVATVALVILSADSILGDKGKEWIASIGADGDTVKIKERMGYLKTAATFAILGATLINIVAAGTTIPANAWGLLQKGAAFIGGGAQLGSAVDRIQNEFHEKERTRWDLEIKNNQHQMSVLNGLIEEAMGHIQQYRTWRSKAMEAHHQAIVGLVK